VALLVFFFIGDQDRFGSRPSIWIGEIHLRAIPFRDSLKHCHAPSTDTTLRGGTTLSLIRTSAPGFLSSSLVDAHAHMRSTWIPGTPLIDDVWSLPSTYSNSWKVRVRGQSVILGPPEKYKERDTGTVVA